MDNLELGEVQLRFAELVWHNAPLPSGELVKICERELHWKKPLLLKMPRSTIPKILSEKYGQTVLRFLKSRLSHSAKNTQVKVQRANLRVSVRL